ncbi:hypothetical protein M2150_000283 [Lachnospiraceae bacterium PM6-15]
MIVKIKKVNKYIAVIILVCLSFLVLANALLRPVRAESAITGTKQPLIAISIGDEYEQRKERLSLQDYFENKASTYEKIPHRGFAKLLQTVGQITELLDIQMTVNKIVREIMRGFI